MYAHTAKNTNMLLKGDGDQAEHISYGSAFSLDGNTLSRKGIDYSV